MRAYSDAISENDLVDVEDEDVEPESTCLVSAADYQEHWEGKGAIPQPVWNGIERRAGLSDRRQPGHERRTPSERGRRYRAGDRRQKGRSA
jgi:hypothetical protein